MTLPALQKSLPAAIVAIALGALCASARATSTAVSGKPPDKPNVLFIIVDDLRPELGCYGKTEVKSPNMDRLASEGLLFQRAYCQFALCMPSRSSVLSGFRPESIHKTLRVSGQVPNGTITLPQLFRNNGYATVSMGKVYHMNDDDPDAWVRRYTDTFAEGNGYCSGYQLPENRKLVQNYFHGKRPASPIVECVDAPDAAHPDSRIASHAVEELRKFKASGEPFFLAAGFYRPHMPCTAPKKYWDLYDRKDIRLPANFKPVEDEIPRPDWDEVRRYGDCPRHGAMPEDKAYEIIHGYHASVSFMDVQIGRVLDELRSLGLDKNTVIVLWGDNGWNLGDHGRWSKLTDYETSTRVAMMIKVPWMAGKRKTDALVELVDLYPTLCELCRLPPPAYLEGTSVVPLLADPQRLWKSAVFSCLFEAKSRTLRTDRYRMIEHPDGQVELYDHRTDPAEDHNLAKDPALAGTLRELHAALEAGWRNARPVTSN